MALQIREISRNCSRVHTKFYRRGVWLDSIQERATILQLEWLDAWYKIYAQEHGEGEDGEAPRGLP
jgi:hypothetical protein